MELLVVGGVDDGDDLRGRHRALKAGEESGGTDAAGQRCEHGREASERTRSGGPRRSRRSATACGLERRPSVRAGSGRAGEALAHACRHGLDRRRDPLGELADGGLHVHDDGLDARRQLGSDVLHPGHRLGDRALGPLPRFTGSGVEAPAAARGPVLQRTGPTGDAVARRLHAVVELAAAGLRLLIAHDTEADGDVARVGERFPDVHCV